VDLTSNHIRNNVSLISRSHRNRQVHKPRNSLEFDYEEFQAQDTLVAYLRSLAHSAMPATGGLSRQITLVRCECEYVHLTTHCTDIRSHTAGADKS